jgi:hypothetical protein
MRVPAQCPRCREIDERRQSMHEVSSEMHDRQRKCVSARAIGGKHRVKSLPGGVTRSPSLWAMMRKPS